jgi:hypothetical protein
LPSIAPRRARFRRLAALATAPTLLLALLGAELAAGGGDGLKYGDLLEEAPDGAVTSAELSCKGSELVGGGVGISGRDEDLEVGSTEPLFSGWRGEANNTSGQAEALTLHAICDSSAIPGDYVTVERSQQVDAGKSGERLARCPGGTRVASGGVGAIPDEVEVEVAATSPFDGADGNATPEDAWRGVVNNETTEEATMSVFAICADRGAYSYEVAEKALPSDSSRRTSVGCPGNKFPTGGGVRIPPGFHPGLEVSDTFPDPVKGERGWIGGGNNESNRDRKLRVFAICGSGFGARGP